VSKKNALGRDLGDLLNRARPARLVEQVGPRPEPGGTPTPAGPETPELPLAPTPPAFQLSAEPPSQSPSSPTAQPGAPLFATPDPLAPLAQRPAASPVFATRQRPPGPAQPLPAGSPGWFYAFLATDVVLLAAAAVLFFTSLVPRPQSVVLAVVAVLIGGVCGGLAYLLRPDSPPKAQDSKVRVQLRRI